VSIGSRTLVGPNVSFFSGTHPLDPDLRNGTNGPEMGACVTVGEDCWIAGGVIILPGVVIGDGCTIGAGSVVTKVSKSVSGRGKSNIIETVEANILRTKADSFELGCSSISRSGR